MSTAQVLEIEIKGSGHVTRPAERAIVSLKADANGSTPSAASADITATAAKIRDMVNDHMLHDENNEILPDSAIAHWSMSKLETSRRFTPASSARGTDATEDKT